MSSRCICPGPREYVHQGWNQGPFGIIILGFPLGSGVGSEGLACRI
jgi:hypothetical protein